MIFSVSLVSAQLSLSADLINTLTEEQSELVTSLNTQSVDLAEDDRMIAVTLAYEALEDFVAAQGMKHSIPPAFVLGLELLLVARLSTLFSEK